MAYTPQIYYPSNYQPQFQQNFQPMQQPIQPQLPQVTNQQTNQGLIWVQGEGGAKSYLMAPSSTVLLMDSESESFYIKMTDSAGMPTLRTFDYKERKADMPQNNAERPQARDTDFSEQFVTKEEYKALLGKYEALSERIDELQKPKTTTKKKEGLADE